MDEKQLQFLYNEYAKGKGFKDYSEFKGLMSSEGSRKLFFDDANKELGFKDYNEFNDLLGLKKKVGGEVSSLTKSQSQEYLSKGQELADKGFIKTEKLDPSQLVSQYKSPDISLSPKPKKNYYSDKLEKGLIFDKEGKLYEPSSEALTKAITSAQQIDLKKPTEKDLVEKSREMPVVEEPVEKQGWLLNTVSALDKGFYKNFISNPIKGLGTIFQGATKKVMGGTGEGFISDRLIKLGDYLNNAIDELTPQDEEFKGTLTDQASQALGQVFAFVLTRGLAGAGKGATTALVSEAPKGAVAAATKAIGSQLSSPTAVSAGLSMGQAEFDRAKEAGATDDQAFEAFYKNAVTGSVLETIPVMQFFKRFNNSTGGSVANYIKTKGVAGLTGGIEEMTTEVLQQIYSNKTAKDIYNINQEILDGVGTSGGIGFGIGFLLNAMGANAKILRKQGKVKEADALENQVKQYEDNLENPKVTSGNKVAAKDIVTQGVEVGTQKAVKNLDRDLANNVITPEQYQEGIVFAEKAAQVADKIPETVTGESRAKSIELLVERNDINQANQNLLQQKQTTDVAYHAGIDQEIKTNEERIKKIDAEVYNIAKKPSKEFGGKKYIVDGEEVSQAEFEALQTKPTEVIEEVKPIRQLGTGANVYFENNKYRVNDNSKGKFLLNIQGKEEGGMAIANIEFNSPKEAVEIAKELSKIYPNGIPDAVLIDKVVDNIRNRIKEEEVKPTEVKETPKQEKKLGKSLISEEPIQGKGVVIATETGLTEQERLDKIAEREKQTKISDKVNTENALVQETKLFYEKNKRQRSSSEGLRKLNELRTRAREIGLEIDDASESVVRKKGSRKTKIKYNSRADADSVIDKSAKNIYERRKDVQDVFKTLNDNKVFLDFKTDLGVRMSDAQLDATIQDILDGVPSKRANRYLDEVQKAIDNDAFGLKDMGNNALTLEQIMESDRDINKIEKEFVGQPMDEKALKDWLNDQSNFTPEEEATMIDDFENLLNEYEYENETRPEAEVPRVKPATEERVATKAEPTEINKKTTSVESKKEVTLQDIYERLPKSEKLKNEQVKEIVDKNFDSIIKQLEKYKIC